MPYRNFRFCTEHSLLEFEVQVLAEIRAALRAAAAASIAPAKHLPKTEAQKVVKNFAEIDRATFEAALSAEACMAETVISGAFVTVRQNGIGLAALFEFFLSVGIIRIAVGMMLERELSIGTLNLLIAGLAGHAQNFIVIAFHLAAQSDFSSQFLMLLPRRLHAETS
jgi:hypothetical protein